MRKGEMTMRPILLGFAAAALSAGVAAAQTTGGAKAASGNDNQAVATTQADAPAPAKGSNSFTRGEAVRRLRSHGFAHVSDLRKDDGGVWRGVASRNGSQVHVWLDYKGNVGTDPS